MIRTSVRAALLLLPLAGCAGLDDPFQRTGTWRPEGLNDLNIAAMTTHPSDLAWGVDDPVSPGQLSAAAVRRLMTDKVKALQNTDIGEVNPQGQSQQAPSAGAGAGAGGTGIGD